MIVNNNLIEWSDRFVLGIPLIDGQHENLIRLTNTLYWSCLQNKEIANLSFIETAHEAVHYIRQHFYTEEKLMLLLDYSDYSSHKKEHQSFIKEVLSQTQHFKDKKNLVPNRFVLFLKEWILSHVAVCDKAMVSFFLETKYRGKLIKLNSKPA